MDKLQAETGGGEPGRVVAKAAGRRLTRAVRDELRRLPDEVRDKGGAVEVEAAVVDRLHNGLGPVWDLDFDLLDAALDAGVALTGLVLQHDGVLVVPRAAGRHPLPRRLGRGLPLGREHVLDRHAGRRPMHYRAVTERALADGLVRTQGRTPEATLYAQILSEVGRRARRGEAGRFVKHGRGYVGLAKWQGHGLAAQVERHNADVRAKLRAGLHALKPVEFEELVVLSEKFLVGGKLLLECGEIFGRAHCDFSSRLLCG